jgi:hypothetical protein
MFAINHAAAALLVKHRFPSVPLVALLVSVQAMELLWVALNYLGVERTTTEPVVRFVGDIHLAYMPFSHSVAAMALAAVAAGLALGVPGAKRLGLAVAIGILSHLVLDLATHDGDIVLAPFIDGEGYGTWLYGRHPALAFAVELGFGALCWRVYRGGRALMWVILGFNLANLSLFFPAIPGPEALLAGRPMWLTTVILFQVLVTLAAVWWAAAPREIAAAG